MILRLHYHNNLVCRINKTFLFSVVLLFPLFLKGQVPTWYNEGFSASPYPVNSTYYLGNATNSWLEGEVSGIVGFPNKWVQTITGGVPVTYQTATGGFLQSTPSVFVTNHAQFIGTGFLQYNNRSINYPNLTNIAQPGDVGFIATRSLDFSGHTIYNATADTLGFWFWRDATSVGGVSAIADSIEVYINTEPFLQGPNLVKLIEKNTLATAIPRSSTLLPLPNPAGNGWRRYTYGVPNTTAYTGISATSNAYVIVVAYSQGGNNMFLDDFTLPEWKTPMVIQSATIFYQENADVSKNSTNNLILGAKITTRGSSSPLKIDAATFSSTGSTAFANDVQAAFAYYSGSASNYSSPAGVINMPTNAAGPAAGLLNFGWAGASCALSSAPATMQLSPGSDNYIWLTYDIKSTAQVQNYVGADFQFITSTTGSTCNYVGSTISTNLVSQPILPQTLNKARLIESTYAIPTYLGGLGVPGYWDFDCISGVFMPGDNGTQLQNYLHDDICPGCQAVHPVGDPLNAYCIRWACHPNDYTNFQPINAGTFKNRFVQVTSGTGVRTGTAPYQLRILGGNVTIRIAAFIDWNKDGDFDDTYTGTTGVPAQDVTINEYYGTHVVTAGNLTQFPVTSWIGSNLWNIQVPTTSDNVVDLNDANQLPNNSTGPLAVSNVRMRLRSSINGVANIGPFTNGYTEGETEDYTIQVLDNCPAPGYNTCKWIGTTSDWNVNTNWCPSIPTINDLAYIPIMSSNFFYPTIGANTNAECRQLKLMDNGLGIGAKLTLDANVNSKLTVADDIIIGQNAPSAGSGASVAVVSNLNKEITIPGKSVLPPLGIALVPQTPFRNNAQAKTQIAYTATELASTYGLKAGDVIDQISIEVAAISPSAGSASFNNFQINAFLTVAPVTFPFPVPASTKIAVAAGDPNVKAGWPKLIYSANPLTLNMPMAGPPSSPCFCGGTRAGGNYFTFNLVPNTLIWDGTSNLVLSFEQKNTSGLNPARTFILYNEAGSVFNVLSINHATVGNTVTGWNIDGQGHYTGGNIVGPTATVSNQRPRLDFTYHRPYEQFKIIVGGKFINNNKLIRASVFSTTPVYNIPGDSGFIASNSKVVFNPTIRSTVSTPGFPGNPGLTVTSSFNPVAQGQILVTDIDQEITSSNNASTVFNCLEIDKLSASGKSVKQNSALVTLTGAYADTLILSNGELNLNRKEFTLKNPASASLAFTNGWIKSEDNVGGLAGNIQSKFSWNIGTQTGLHTIPFGLNSSTIFPFQFDINAGDVGVITIGTYGTPQNNLAYPVNPTVVASLTSQGLPAANWTVDRFWMVKRSTTNAISGNIKFSYPVSEGTSLATYSAGNMKAQRYEFSGSGWAWHLPYAGQSDGNPGIPFVNHDASYISNTNTIWTIVSLNNGQTPLPLELINFDAKAFNDKVKLWWSVANETNVNKYIVERTSDQNNFSFISSRSPSITSVNNASYELFDNAPLKGLQYYRLKTLKTTGETMFSDLKPIVIDAVFEITNTSSSLSLQQLKIDFFYNSNLPYNYKIVDLLGDIVSSGKGYANIGQNSITVPLNTAAGIYFISLGNSEKTITKKIVFY